MALTVPASRIAVTNGASGALNLAFACLADPGSEWLLTDPGYPCNRHIMRVSKGDRSTSRSARKQLPADASTAAPALERQNTPACSSPRRPTRPARC
jgi:aspartate/methionine/tyrosine aminotransferase